MRYAAFLRGVSPMNCKMPALASALLAAGFTDVKTHLSSGNAVFTAPSAKLPALEQRVEAALAAALGRPFPTHIRPIPALASLLDSDPFARYPLPRNAKRIVTFLRAPSTAALPPRKDGAQILAVVGTEVLSMYTPSPKGPVFMTVLERTFGKDITTRTWETVSRVASR
ncbi:MAG TPA: DUF1697 domain-containing protein [Kofleriaceae bacterium]|jgi:uncharacterized protein (DUF1697 family)